MAKRARRVVLEVCVASVDDAVAAARAGADRLELNLALDLGGLTPSAGLLHAVLDRVEVPVIAMIRPRQGGCAYGRAALAVMQHDVTASLAAGAAGIAVGVLAEDGTIDRDVCGALLRDVPAGGRVFHRAFDLTPDANDALEILVDLGVDRVLTSGHADTAWAGRDVLRRLRARADGRIEILAGGGVTPANAAALVRETGVDQVHGSFRRPQIDPSARHRRDIAFGPRAGADGEGSYPATDAATVAAVRAVLDARDGRA